MSAIEAQSTSQDDPSSETQLPAHQSKETTTGAGLSVSPISLSLLNVDSTTSGKEVLVPPLNFAMVAPDVYRAGHPNKTNFAFLDSLHLKSIMYMATDNYRSDTFNWAKRNGLKIFHVRMEGNKEPFVEMSHEDVASSLATILDSRNLPILVHCNKGKHRVGTLIGCLRKLQGWSYPALFDEYARFDTNRQIMLTGGAGGVNARVADQEFIELFDVRTVKLTQDFRPEWL